MSNATRDFPTPDAQTFSSALGQAVWLMTMSKAHRDQPISLVEDLISPAILFRQFKLYSKGKQPVAFLVWASVSDDLKTLIEAGARKLEPQDWRSGSNIIILDCISPFNPPETFQEKFLASMKDAK